MRVLHLASLDSASANIGIVRQMHYEQEAAKFVTADWVVELWASDGLRDFEIVKPYPVSVKGWLKRRKFLFDRINSAATEFDVIIVRYAPADLFLPFIKVLGAKVFFIHHTKQTYALKVAYPGFRGIALALLERMVGYVSIGRVDGIIAVTPEILDYEAGRTFRSLTRKYTYPNGIDFDSYESVEDRRKGAIKILFTASTFHTWHGLSSVLDSIAALSADLNFELHLVGHVLEGDRQFISNNNLTEVTIHGYLDEVRLRRLSSSMDLALASFHFVRQNMTQACTLKVREYLAAGLGVYSGHVDVGLPDAFVYYKIGEPDIQEIVSFARSLRNVSRISVREAAREYIDKKDRLRDLVTWLNTAVR
jgi:glycosyltransferase involved in cell wall biosynthesis